MEFLYCPDCFGSDFTEEFDCRECQTSFLTGKKISLEQKLGSLQSGSPMVSVSTKEVVKQPFEQKILAVAGSFLILICLAGIIYQELYGGKIKSLKTVGSQLFVQNDLNKFTVKTNDKTSLTAISLTQENIKVSADGKSFSNIKLLFDCVIDGEVLTRTPDEYHITIISDDAGRKDLELPSLEFQTAKESFTVEKQNGDHLVNGNDSLEYACHRISRKELEKLADSTQINFRIGDYRGQLNFAQQQSIRSFLTATSLDSRIN